MDVALVGLCVPGLSNHSLAALSSAVRDAGYVPALVPFAGWPDLEQAANTIMRGRPRVCGISIQTTEAALASVSLARVLRARGYQGRVVCGGHFATLNAQEILHAPAGIDAVVRFAGEKALVGLLREPSDAELANLPGLVFRDTDGTVRVGAPAEVQLDGLPQVLEEMAGLPLHLGFRAADLILSHGCEHHCSYCCVAAASQLARKEAQRAGAEASAARYQRFELAAVADKIMTLYHDREARVFTFMDDNVLPAEPSEAAAWAWALREALDRRGVGAIAVSMQLRADAVSEQSAAALAALGLSRAYVGIDGYSRQKLRVLGRRAAAEAGPRAVAALTAQGVFVVCNALLLGPTVPVSVLHSELPGLAAIQGAPVHLLPIDVRAGTPYFQTAERLGLIEGSFLWRHYRFVDPQTEQVARVITALPTRLEQLSVPIALYDLGYNLGLAQKLLPEVDLTAQALAYRSIADRWNADQVRVLRAALAAAALGPEAVDALIDKERSRVTAHDKELLQACQEELLQVERRVTRARGAPARAHERGRILSAVALSMSLAACTSVVTGPPDAAITTDAAMSRDAARLDSPDLTIDAGSCPDGRQARIYVDTPCECMNGNIIVVLDDNGIVIDIRAAADGGVVPDEVRKCLIELFAKVCYPSLAGTSQWVRASCWIA